jgi:hypothetical protein
MKRLSSLLAVVALGGCLATVDEQGRRGGGEATFTLSLPTVLPPLIVVQPGLSVARDLDEEVFYADGWYWARQDGSWYRSHDHRGGWARVEGREVPTMIGQSPPGRYRQYRGEEHHGSGEDRDGRGGHEGHEEHASDHR